MKIHSVTLKNFRGYRDDTTINFEDLTAFVGRNDIGKSTILEALDIFFNDGKGIVKLDKDDINVDARKQDDTEIKIAVCFDDLPDRVVIDSSSETTLAQEYLLNAEGRLEIIKRYPNAGSAKVSIHALHPSHPQCKDLMKKKDSDLRTIIDKNDIPCADKTKNPVMRDAIRMHYKDDLGLEMAEINIGKDETKSVWEKLQRYLPDYWLFQADRENSDGDSEVQDPLKAAVRRVMNSTECRDMLKHVAEAVVQELNAVAERTLDKLGNLDPNIADNLKAVIPAVESLKWADVFKGVNISTDDDIPINKRGSGIKRMVLLSFFQAEVERIRHDADGSSIIYAIEEPETAQHYDSQKKMIKALLDLAKVENTQIIMTTHSATVVKELNFDVIRLVREVNGRLVVEHTPPRLLPYPTLNEINYLAFDETTAEYFDELYGYLVEKEHFKEYKKGKERVAYKKLWKGQLEEQQLTKTEYIRHQIHHPENKNNPLYTQEDLCMSIAEMRDFIQNLPAGDDE